MECDKDKESRNAYIIFVELYLRKFPAGKLRLKLEYSIKADTGNGRGISCVELVITLVINP